MHNLIVEVSGIEPVTSWLIDADHSANKVVPKYITDIYF